MNKLIYNFLVFLCLLFVNTLNSQVLTSSPPVPPVVGDCLADGVVFYIFQPGDAGYVDGETHGLVVSLDQGLERWGCFGTDLPSVPSVSLSASPTDQETVVGARIGDGETNTNEIVQDCPNGNAADWCLDKGPEWFLPSRGELNELYKWYAKDTLGNNNLMVNCGGVGIATDWHWSSTEGGNYSAWLQNFKVGIQILFNKFKKLNYVRAVRAF